MAIMSVVNKKKQTISAKRVVVTSFLVDVLDILLSLFVAVLSGSVVMLTQVLEGISDLISSGFLLVGLVKSRQKADRVHPFGYGREIYFWTLLAALVMFGITSTFSIYLGYKRFIVPEPIHNLTFAFFVLFLTLGTNGYAFLLSYKRLLKKRRHIDIVKIFYKSSLVETKTTFILDLMGTTASFLGILALGVYAVTGDLRFDGLGAMLMGTVLALFSFLLIAGIRDLLIGKSASLATESRIKKAAMEIPEVKNILGIKTLHIGSEKLLVNLDVHLQSKLTTRQIEKLIDDVKEAIREKVPSAKHIQVELETPR